MPNIETAIYVLSGIKYFYKTEFKSAYNQMRIDEKFKELTMTNSSIGLLREKDLTYGVKMCIFFFQSAI